MTTLTAAGTTGLHPLLAGRRSPRAFEPFPLPDEQVAALLEAARWAPSAMNAQPWRFVVGRIGPEGPDRTHDALFATLAGGNQAWAGRAPLLIAAIVRVQEEEGGARAIGPYELGLAVAQMTVQAEALGLAAHQIGGFDADALARAFSVPDGYRALAVVAIGPVGDASLLPDWARAREGAPRTRLALQDIAFAGRFGEPLELTTAAEGDAESAAA